ncbi:hypothetical protein PIB30_027292 [Stylosanthes scabra]|uniref:Uncharacterized protein n=1 Tax=Stylosanthes scabra TaxID=79078 RepID=A0ABU6Y8X5_9FABA|nr:hypothetical protein [Stylosanthes scabra]
MGLPVCLWCEENIERVAKLWGKVVEHDDRSTESKSYTTARVLIDCYQWEMVHKWVSIKVDDRTFDVFVKETGAEAYSVQAHPDLVKDYSASMDESKSVSRVVETPVGAERRQTISGLQNSNQLNDDDPQLIAIIDANYLNDVPPINVISDGMGVEEAGREDVHRVNQTDFRCLGEIECGLRVDDPMFDEARPNVLVGSQLLNNVGPKNVDWRPSHSGSSGFCPFPPGFGPNSEMDLGPGQGDKIRVVVARIEGNDRKDLGVGVKWRKESDGRLDFVEEVVANPEVDGAVQGDAEGTHEYDDGKRTAYDDNDTGRERSTGCSFGRDAILNGDGALVDESTVKI